MEKKERCAAKIKDRHRKHSRAKFFFSGQGGLVYARVGNNQGQLTVKWGESVGMQCLISYLLMPQAEGQRQSIQRFETPCLPPSGVASSSSPLQLSTDRRRR
ncbi:FimD/PapC C-terminal domain-containing protein [Neisseria gonorrhoeae]|uniref:FimD/PapC C-terminal domain-containing protein n=1 Tax=Neisseria gonorrhoeae TaxID=485 RepID=UPI001C9A08BD|nr:FimD/PapC C-terminal domain-containing protein [Neisseria gonorrhoeae]